MTGMAKVVTAAERLERAVIRLEAAVENMADADQRREIGRALANAKAQYAALAQVTQTVAQRLDQAIDRLDRELEI